MLSAFNYAQGVVEGVEFSGKFHSGNFQAYANLALGFEKATDVVSNEYLFDNTTPLADLGGETLRQYVDSHWIYTDHTQLATGSAGAAYLFCGRPAYAGETFNADELSWCGTRLSGDMIYGSGLRSGDANIGTVPPYAQFNVGIARSFLLPNDPLPMTVRFDVVNLFDTVYLIRGSSAACPSGNSVCGIGVFAPQYGPRLGFFAGVSKKFGDTSAASAAYLPGQALALIYKAPPVVYNWTGFYVGGNLGGAWSGLSGNSWCLPQDKAALLVSLLRTAGLNSYPVLINVGTRMDQEAPDPFFNHAIVLEIKGKYTLMDPTDEHTRNLLPFYDCNQSYLVCRPEGEDLKTSWIRTAGRTHDGY